MRLWDGCHKASQDTTSGDDAVSLYTSLSSEALTDPELAEIVAALPELDLMTRRSILLLVRAARHAQEEAPGGQH
jgi:hypothetical protein